MGKTGHPACTKIADALDNLSAPIIFEYGYRYGKAEITTCTTVPDVTRLVTQTLDNKLLDKDNLGTLDKEGNLRKPPSGNCYTKRLPRLPGRVRVYSGAGARIAQFDFIGDKEICRKQADALTGFINERYGIKTEPIQTARKVAVAKVKVRKRRLGHRSKHHPRFVKLCEDIVAAYNQ